MWEKRYVQNAKAYYPETIWLGHFSYILVRFSLHNSLLIIKSARLIYMFKFFSVLTRNGAKVHLVQESHGITTEVSHIYTKTAWCTLVNTLLIVERVSRVQLACYSGFYLISDLLVFLNRYSTDDQFSSTYDGLYGEIHYFFAFL